MDGLAREGRATFSVLPRFIALFGFCLHLEFSKLGFCLDVFSHFACTVQKVVVPLHPTARVASNAGVRLVSVARRVQIGLRTGVAASFGVLPVFF